MVWSFQIQKKRLNDVLNRPVSQMQVPLAACHEPIGSCDRLCEVLYVLNIKRKIF